MKTLPLLILCVLFTSCTTTTLFDRKTGKPIARFSGDMVNSRYRDGSTSWDVDQVSHSATVRAWGSVLGTGLTGAAGFVVAGKTGLLAR